MKIFVEILFNLSTITVFGIISSLVGTSKQKIKRRQVFHGIIFGSGAVIGMLNPVIIKPGLIFDGRSVLISLAGLIYGPLSAIISASMALTLRIIQGGVGVWMGCSVIVVSASVGVIFHYKSKAINFNYPIQQLFSFGLLVHFLMILCTIALPRNIIVSTIQTIALPVMIIYPLATVVLGKILSLILSRSYLLETVQDIVDNAPFGAHRYELEPGGRLIFIGSNRAAETILGVNHHQFIGKTIEHAFPDLTKTDVPEAYKNVAATGQPYNVDQIQYNEGEISGAYEIHAFNTGSNRMTVFFRDITELKKTEKALAENEKIFRSFMENSPIYVFFKDENIRPLRLSNNYEMLLGRPIDELLGKSMDELFPSDFAKKMVEVDKTVLRERNTIQIEEYFNGRYFTTIKFPIIIDEQHKFLAGYTIDITDKKQAEIELKNLNEGLEERVVQRTSELEKSNKALQSFSYSVSHDLRAPLRAIEGFSRILLEDYLGKLDSTGSRYLTIISESVGRMNQLINGLLLISRASHSELIKSKINMKDMVSNILNELKESNQLPLQVEVKFDELLVGYGDPALIRQVWVNFLENAIKFCSTKEHPTITLSSYTENGTIVFLVRDNGVGFNQKYAKQLFNVFQRLHSPDEFPGVGIGLALVERIIHRHSGRVWAEGEEGVGATFYFSLPLCG